MTILTELSKKYFSELAKMLKHSQNNSALKVITLTKDQ
jgi:hypothetical protein